jgi:outer membrane protein assembly factor BamE
MRIMPDDPSFPSLLHPAITMQNFVISVSLMAVLGLSACSSILDAMAHKIDVQQGNIITQDMVNELRPGMDPGQVRSILGTPLLADPFHPERWDYVYSMKRPGHKPEERHITVLFQNDRLARIEGDVRSEASP